MSDAAREAVERLLFELENRTGFWFALVVAHDPPHRAAVREAARDWCEAHGRKLIAYDLAQEDAQELAARLVDAAGDAVHWVVASGPDEESSRRTAAAFLAAMNERRDAYRRRLQAAVIVEGGEALKRELRVMAPDLFSIRAAVIEPALVPSPPTTRTFPDPLLHLDRQVQRARTLAALHGLRNSQARGLLLISVGIGEQGIETSGAALAATAKRDFALWIERIDQSRALKAIPLTFWAPPSRKGAERIAWFDLGTVRDRARFERIFEVIGRNLPAASRSARIVFHLAVVASGPPAWITKLHGSTLLRVEVLPTLEWIDKRDLRDFLTGHAPDALIEVLAERLVQRSGGSLESTTDLLRRGAEIGWTALLDELRLG